MKKITIFLILSFCFTETNIGWVDSQYIFNQLEETREAQVQIEKKQRNMESDLMNMISKRDSLLKDYQTKAPLMGPEMQKNNRSSYGPLKHLILEVKRLKNMTLSKYFVVLMKVSQHIEFFVWRFRISITVFP